MEWFYFTLNRQLSGHTKSEDQERNVLALGDMAYQRAELFVPFPTGTRPLPAWSRALWRLAQSKVITVKHQGVLCTFGAGLPDDEIKYLYSLIRRSLAGKL